VIVMAMAMAAAACSGGGETSLEGITRKVPLEVGEVTLPDVTRGGDTPFTMRAREGELLVAYFGYTHCPDVCPTTLSALRSALRTLGPDAASRVDLAFVTVDPVRDTPQLLTDYLGSFTSRFHAIRTTDLDALHEAEKQFLARSSIRVGEGGRMEVTHTGTAYVVDLRGTVLVEWPFGIAARAMADDLATLLEAAEV
jgi:protein SCO1/2